MSTLDATDVAAVCIDQSSQPSTPAPYVFPFSFFSFESVAYVNDAVVTDVSRAVSVTVCNNPPYQPPALVPSALLPSLLLFRCAVIADTVLGMVVSSTAVVGAGVNPLRHTLTSAPSALAPPFSPDTRGASESADTEIGKAASSAIDPAVCVKPPPHNNMYVNMYISIYS